MTTKENKDFIDYLKKETERLTNAINKAHEPGNMGKRAIQEQMRDAFQKFLNKLSR
jgi:hypothetical protein